MNEKFVVLILGLLYLIIPSLIFGLIGFLSGLGFWLFFLIGGFIFWVIGDISNRYINKKNDVIIEQLKLEQLNIEEKYIAETYCSYCNHRNRVKVSLNTENFFTCNSCNQKNSLKFNFKAFRTTEPITDSHHMAVIKDILKKTDELEKKEFIEEIGGLKNG